MDLTVEQRSLLSRLTFYIWWQSAEESLERPERLIAQIMDIGDWEDECELEETFSHPETSLLRAYTVGSRSCTEVLGSTKWSAPLTVPYFRGIHAK